MHELAALCDLLYRKNDAACLEAMHSILNEILYLFKDSSYAYEKEVRICYQYPGVDETFRHTPGEFGKLYVATDFPVAIKEVILGPKFLNRSEVYILIFRLRNLQNLQKKFPEFQYFFGLHNR